MSVLDDFQTAIQTKIIAACPDLNSVELHYGAFNVDEVSRRMVDSPAAFVAIPTVKPGNTYSNSVITGMAEVMVVILSRDVGLVIAPIVARNIMLQILTLAKWNAFANPTMPAMEIEGTELHYDKLDPMGLAMCVVSWQQELLIDGDAYFAIEQSRQPDFSFPPMPSNAPDDVVVNATLLDPTLHFENVLGKSSGPF